MPNPGIVLAVCCILLLAVAVVFGQTIRHEFVNYDDHLYLSENHHVIHGLTAQGVVWAFTTRYAENWHPLTWLSHMLDCQFYGRAAGGHHLTNVLLHAANAVLLFLVLWRMTGDLWPSTFVAVVFAIHPLRVESVAWVAERKDVLSGLFFLLTLGAYVGYVRRPFSILRYLAVVILFALGLMVKPMLVTVPCVLLLLDYWPLGRVTRGASVQRLSQQSGRFAIPWRLAVEKVPLLALAAASCVATIWAQDQAVASVDVIPVSSRVGNALVSYAAYVGQCVYPVGLAVFYPHPGDGLGIGKVVGAFLLATGISVGALMWRRGHPYVFVGWFWYLGMLLPVIGLVQVGSQAMADRYTYLPQIGLCMALAWGAAEFVASRRQWRRVCEVVSLLVVLALMGCAWRQTSYWRDSETLWKRALACTSRNAIAHINLGNVLSVRERTAEAIDHYRVAIKLSPNYAEAHNDLGAALADQRELYEAIHEYQRALELKPAYADAESNLGNALARCGQVAAAVAHYQKALKIRPDFLAAHCSLGLAMASLGRMDEAIAQYQEVLKIKPDHVDARNNLGDALASRGQTDEAIGQFQKVLQIDPNHVNAHYNLGKALQRQGKSEDAIRQWREALRLQPNHVGVINQLAWVLVTSPDAQIRKGAEGLELAQRALQLTGGGEPVVLGTLAAAYAETGRLSDAVETAQRAVSLASARGDSALVDAVRAQIKFYESGAPYRETPKLPRK